MCFAVFMPSKLCDVIYYFPRNNLERHVSMATPHFDSRQTSFTNLELSFLSESSCHIVSTFENFYDLD